MRTKGCCELLVTSQNISTCIWIHPFAVETHERVYQWIKSDKIIKGVFGWLDISFIWKFTRKHANIYQFFFQNHLRSTDKLCKKLYNCYITTHSMEAEQTGTIFFSVSRNKVLTLIFEQRRMNLVHLSVKIDHKVSLSAMNHRLGDSYCWGKQGNWLDVYVFIWSFYFAEIYGTFSPLSFGKVLRPNWWISEKDKTTGTYIFCFSNAFFRNNMSLLW